jgi:Domain of unknown function (DUF222)
MFEVLVETGDRLAGLVDLLDPERITGSRARDLWNAFDRIERLAAAGKTLLARRVAATHTRTGSTDRSAVEEMGRRAGTSTKAARDAVETSTKLTELPEVDAALRRGQLSPAQADLVAGAAAANPAEQRRLLELAEHGSLVELREECLRVKANADPDPEATHRRIHQHRYLRRYTDAEGGWNLRARGTPDQGAVFNTVLDPIIDQIFGNARREDRHEPPEAYAFDALLTMAERAAGADRVHTAPQSGKPPANTPVVAADATDGTADALDLVGDCQPKKAAGQTNNGAPESASSATNRRRQSRVNTPTARPGSNRRHLALLRIDVEALRRGTVQDEELCEITGVGPIPVQVARDLLGDAIIKLIITRGVDVLNVTHLGRGPTAAQRAALLWTNPTCTVQGCHRSRVEVDHRDPWANTHHTRLDELDPLCHFHHDLKTHRGYALARGAGKRPLVAPDDPRHPEYEKTSPKSRADP